MTSTDTKIHFTRTRGEREKNFKELEEQQTKENFKGRKFQSHVYAILNVQELAYLKETQISWN